MEQIKKTYYIDIENTQVYSEPVEDADWQFKIFATDEELAQLNHCINENYDSDLKTFTRAHVPFLEYHKESKNDEYDETMAGIYRLIYDLGDEEARRHIEGMGIL
ncbi:hydrolase [Cytobacillus sp. NCCP-133]|uniref:hydrolase n=1 Tax=Cytobacillus sp. NCCP-133 TaxID=766848 RepID=UPI00222F5EDF|nr:hydrolase [Cytobacillus sp. NCCP-133]GLB59459.1 hypothetical protein NCCP133_15920 [Cytobacillus sp. NCCP-133]